MRIVESHLLEEKMDEAVTHYINSHHTAEPMHVDANNLALNVQVDSGRVITVMHSQGFSSQLGRQISVSEQVGDGPWTEELLDPEGRLDALVAHLTQHSRTTHHQVTSQPKVSSVRGDVDASVILDAPLRLFNGQTLDTQSEIVVQVPPLPPLQQMKRCQDADWFKAKGALKTDTSMLSDPDSQVLELNPGASPVQNKQQSKKSLPHKKRISRKLKRNGNSTPQQDIVVISCAEEVPHEEILPDNFVAAVQHQDHLPEETHHIAHEVRPMFICTLCGEYYGEEQVKFFHHLKQHYEPHGTIIIENPVSDLGIDKMTNTCIVDNVPALPDSIVELSLENTVPKTMYQPMDKSILYSTSDKALYTNKVLYSMATMDKETVVAASEVEKAELYETLDKLELYSCSKCSRSFRKQRQCEAHIKEAHSSKLEDMGEFSEPEDLMAGIHVAVEEGGDQYEQTLLPHLTVENGHVHQEHVRLWYMRGSGSEGSCGAEGAEGTEGAEGGEGPEGEGGEGYCPVCPARAPPPPRHDPNLKEEVLQRIFGNDVPTGHQFPDTIITELPPDPPPQVRASKPPERDGKKKSKIFECPQCGRVFQHRNSLLYHTLSHIGKQQVCRECGKGFYTASALKIHKRVHNGDRPYKCDECGREFRQWSDLKYHKVSLHSNQKHFKCEFCGKEFARKYSLNVHRRIHTGEKNYKCDYCTKTFRASSYRLSHMRTHTGDRPYKCAQCNKGFRVAGDMRRHMLTHEKIRSRLEEYKKIKEEKPKKPEIKDEKLDKTEEIKTKKIALASTTRPQIVRTEKKQKSSKKNLSTKISPPNVTVTLKEQFKLNTEFPNNVEVFDTRQEFHKFKEVYSEAEYNKEAINHYKVRDYDEQMIGNYKNEQRLADERDLATIRPMFRNNLCSEIEKPFDYRESGTKMHFAHEKGKDYSVPMSSNTVTLSDIRTLERERAEIHGEIIENSFLDKLTAIYNIPAV